MISMPILGWLSHYHYHNLGFSFFPWLLTWNESGVFITVIIIIIIIIVVDLLCCVLVLWWFFFKKSSLLRRLDRMDG